MAAGPQCPGMQDYYNYKVTYVPLGNSSRARKLVSETRKVERSCAMTHQQSPVVTETTPRATQPVAQERRLGTSEYSLMLAIVSCAYKTLQERRAQERISPNG